MISPSATCEADLKLSSMYAQAKQDDFQHIKIILICVLPEVAELEKQFRLVDQDVVGLDIGVDNVGLLHYLQG